MQVVDSLLAKLTIIFQRISTGIQIYLMYAEHFQSPCNLIHDSYSYTHVKPFGRNGQCYGVSELQVKSYSHAFIILCRAFTKEECVSFLTESLSLYKIKGACLDAEPTDISISNIAYTGRMLLSLEKMDLNIKLYVIAMNS